MSRVKQKEGSKGSLRWIQWYVNNDPNGLNAALAAASGGRIGGVEWRSPLQADHYAEYSDGAFLERLGLNLSTRTLDSFWPKRGPQWDALGVTVRDEPVLVEAKSSIAELITPPTAASEPARGKISSALKETADHLGIKPTCDWSRTFYQYANRLAHLYLLNELNQSKAWLVFVYFVGDSEVSGPSSEAEWKTALQVMEGALGVRRHRLLQRKLNVFLDVPSAS
jgi:hypothetical protein